LSLGMALVLRTEGKIHFLPDGMAARTRSTLIRETDDGGGAMAALLGTEHKDGYNYTISLKQVGRIYTWRVFRTGHGVAYTVARGRALTPIKAMDDAFAARRKLVQAPAGKA